LPGAAVVPPKPGKPRKTRARGAQQAFAEALAPTAAAAISAAPTMAMADPYGEASIPRWRRQSLKTARYASPRIAAAPIAALTFAGGAASGLERRRVRYDLVALTDIPDEIRGTQVGQLQANDEVEITGRQGAWVKVRTPVGAEGWIHRTTLQANDDLPDAPAAVAPPRVAATRPSPTPDSIEADVAMGAFAVAARARSLEASQAVAAVSEPVTESKPAKGPRAGRATTPKTPTAPKKPKA
jgi:hypothetical protein